MLVVSSRYAYNYIYKYNVQLHQSLVSLCEKKLVVPKRKLPRSWNLAIEDSRIGIDTLLPTKIEAMSALEKSGHWQQTLSLDRFWMVWNLWSHGSHVVCGSLCRFFLFFSVEWRYVGLGTQDLDSVNGFEYNFGLGGRSMNLDGIYTQVIWNYTDVVPAKSACVFFRRNWNLEPFSISQKTGVFFGR